MSPQPSRARVRADEQTGTREPKYFHERPPPRGSQDQPEKPDVQPVPLRLPSANHGKTVYPLNEMRLKSRENGLNSCEIAFHGRHDDAISQKFSQIGIFVPSCWKIRCFSRRPFPSGQKEPPTGKTRRLSGPRNQDTHAVYSVNSIISSPTEIPIFPSFCAH